jgi:peptidoglycan/xylan/chitin deacetylase (PgdA/CDA1 family)
VSGYLSGPVWYRPPYGIGDHPLPGYAGPVGWHAHGRDWDITYRQGQTVTGCVEQIMATLIQGAGGVVLLHDFAPRTEFLARRLTEGRLDLRVLEVVALLLSRLRESGFQLVGLPGQASPKITDSAEKIS